MSVAMTFFDAKRAPDPPPPFSLFTCSARDLSTRAPLLKLTEYAIGRLRTKLPQHSTLSYGQSKPGIGSCSVEESPERNANQIIASSLYNTSLLNITHL